jgi:cytochrome c
MRNSVLLAALTLMLAVPAGAEDGQTLFNNACRTCHSMKPGDNRLGPTLSGVIGRKAGSVEGFAYSDSMKSSGLVWDEAALDKFIADPEAMLRGNRMKPFGGVSDAATRSAIVAFLKSH